MAGMPNPNSLSSRVLRYMEQHPDATNEECADAVGCNIQNAIRRISDGRRKGLIPYPAHKRKRVVMIETHQPTPIENESPPIPSDEYAGLEGFRKLYDKAYIIREKIDTELKRRGWYYDDDFRVICKMSVNDWKRIRNDFAHLQFQLPDKRMVWGHPEVIDKMKEFILR